MKIKEKINIPKIPSTAARHRRRPLDQKIAHTIQDKQSVVVTDDVELGLAIAFSI